MFCGVVMVGAKEAVIVERLGMYHRTLESGLHWIWPFFENVRYVSWSYTEESFSVTHIRHFRGYKIDLREQVFDPPPFEICTRDMLQMHMDVVVWYTIHDAKKAVYEIKNLYQSIEQVVATRVKGAASRTLSSELLDKMPDIEKETLTHLDDATTLWGVTVTSIQLQGISANAQSTQRAPAWEIVENNGKLSSGCGDGDLLQKRASTHTGSEVAESPGEDGTNIFGWKRDELREETSNRMALAKAKQKAETQRLENQLQVEHYKSLRKDELFTGDQIVSMHQTNVFRQMLMNGNVQTLIVPYDAAKFLGASQIVHTLAETPNTKTD